MAASATTAGALPTTANSLSPPSTPFTVLTMNIWFSGRAWRERAGALIKAIERAKLPDIVCLQEVRPVVLREALAEEGGALVENYHFTDAKGDTLGGYGVIILVHRRHTVRQVVLTPLPTHLGRSLVSVVVDFIEPALVDCSNCTETSSISSIVADDNISGASNNQDSNSSASLSRVIVATVHLESMAGNVAKRAQQLQVAFPVLRKLQTDHKASAIILTGDFNFCSASDENAKNIPNDFIDVWPFVRQQAENGTDYDPGWTENSDRNEMMFSEKRRDKHVRFDRILVDSASRWKPVNAELFGCEPIDDVFSAASPLSALTKTWISDHFGVVAQFNAT